VYNYNCPSIKILLVKYCVEQKFYCKCNATKSTLLSITLDCRSCYDNSRSELKAITSDLHGFAIGDLWILVSNNVAKMY
jgi:hypothetical protein